MPLKNVRQRKNELRAVYKRIRVQCPQDIRQSLDRQLAENFWELEEYKVCKTLFVFVSTPIEVDTYRLINKALEDGKVVAVPRCVPGTRDMEMCFIGSMADLEPGMYGIPEPKASCAICSDWSDCLCIVPAFCNDKKGYRLGYGGGYYDRFLSQFSGMTVGINYSECVRKELQHGRYDVPIQMLLTERDRFYF